MKSQKLFRIIIPSFPEVNIYSRPARLTTALGPIMVATAANLTTDWQVEVIDENNYRGPRNNSGLPDHSFLQEERPADVVGFYCGLTSTIERVWDLAKFYRDNGAFTVAGGFHAFNFPKEQLEHNIHVVVHGEAEGAIGKILDVFSGREVSLFEIPGISFMDKKHPVITKGRLEFPNLNNLPFPDFGLLKYAKVKIYPIGRIRGCSMFCEFCSVRGKVRWQSPEYLFNLINWLNTTRGARKFFLVDDRMEEDFEGSFRFFEIIREKYGNILRINVQTRLETARKPEFLKLMKEAGVSSVFIGYESPETEDLKAMKKGYSSSKMIEWTKILRKYFWVHGMFIFGYPKKNGNKSQKSGKERAEIFSRFIKKAGLDSVQVLHPIPLPGTELRARLEKEGRVFPLEVVPWRKYDGNTVCFIPDDMTVREFQELPIRIMKRFYGFSSFFRLCLRTFLFPFDYLLRGWNAWHAGWKRDFVRYFGHRLVVAWQKKQKEEKFVEKLEDHLKS